MAQWGNNLPERSAPIGLEVVEQNEAPLAAGDLSVVLYLVLMTLYMCTKSPNVCNPVKNVDPGDV